MKTKINYKDYSTLKLHLTRSKAGVVSLKTITQETLARSGGYGYDKTASCFKDLFQKLGFEVAKLDYNKFDLLNQNIEEANQFLVENNINYKVNYRSEINKNISFIELQKIDN